MKNKKNLIYLIKYYQKQLLFLLNLNAFLETVKMDMEL